MRYMNFFVVTRNTILSSTIENEWLAYNMDEHLPNPLPRGKIDVFDDHELFLPAIASITKSLKKPFLSRFRKNYTIVFYIDELDSKLRKRLFIDGFQGCMKTIIFLAEIGPSVVTANNEGGYKHPTIVAAVVGDIIELTFCFAGGKIINHVVCGEFDSELEAFIDECELLRQKPLCDFIELDRVKDADKNVEKEELIRIWNGSEDLTYILATNEHSVDEVQKNKYFSDCNKVHFNDMTAVVKKNFNEVLGGFRRAKKAGKKSL